MIDWLSGGRYRLHALILGYFAIHVIVRTFLSPSLDYDESEQTFLSQWWLLGYNSQPPLYTWMQAALFNVFGYNVFPLALLKNGLLCLTYLCVFGAIHKATGDIRPAMIAAFGMLMIPQIAWESHRDLSHTVSVTFTAALLLYCVVSLLCDRRTRWYVALGVTCGCGMMFKYNFAIVMLAMIVAAMTVPAYRVLLRDRRLGLSVAIAAIIILPHAVWVFLHPDLASSKTLATLTTDRSEYWIENVAGGYSALVVSILSCCGLAVAGFFITFRRSLGSNLHAESVFRNVYRRSTMLLLERFLIAVVVILFALVLTGHALEFKNRWIQPFVFLVPAYLALKFRHAVLFDRDAVNRGCQMSLGIMVVVLAAVIARPMLGQYRHKYCWLNVPYTEVAAEIASQLDDAPDVIVVPNMRLAGNLRMHFPNTWLLSLDNPHVSARPESLAHLASARTAVIVTDQSQVASQRKLIRYANGLLKQTSEADTPWTTIDIGYRFGAEADKKRFFVAGLQTEPGKTVKAAAVIDDDEVRR